MSNDSDWKDKNLPVSNFIGATPSSDTNELDRALKTLSQFFFEPTAKPTMAQVWGRAKIDILKWAATKEAEAYKAGMVKEATHRLTDAVDRLRRLDKDALKEFLKELKGGI